MIKLMIVDDEPGQVRALAKIIGQLKPEYEIHTAYSAQEALDFITDNTIDVMITDIRMPNMDGLQLIERLLSLGSKMKFVILSGYGEFEYAQKAIRFGINDYIVKPISKSDLKDLLDNIEKNIQTEINEKQKEEDINRKLNNTLPVYLEHQMNKWISGRIGKNDLSAIKSIFPFDGYGMVLVTFFSKFQDSQDFYEQFIYDAKFTMNKAIKNCGHSISFSLENDKQKIVTIIVNDKPVDFSSKESLNSLEEYIREIKKIYSISATIGLSEKSQNILLEIEEAFQKAQESVESSFFFGIERVIPYKDSFTQKNSSKYNVMLIENQFTEAVQKKDKTAVSKITSSFFEGLKNNPNIKPQQLKDEFSHLLLSQAKYAINYLDKESYASIIAGIREKPQLCDGYSELWHFVNETLFRIIDLTDDFFKDKNTILINKCKKYIDENYMDDISLENVAKKYFFNPSYFSNLFKTHTGLGFSEYLLSVRILHAKELLKASGDSMSEIASKVGFRDPSYFNRMFKRETGISPLKYRQLNEK